MCYVLISSVFCKSEFFFLIFVFIENIAIIFYMNATFVSGFKSAQLSFQMACWASFSFLSKF